MHDIYSNPLAAEVLKGWGIEFSRTLLDMNAIIMHVAKFSQGSNTYIYKTNLILVYFIYIIYFSDYHNLITSSIWF